MMMGMVFVYGIYWDDSTGVTVVASMLLANDPQPD